MTERRSPEAGGRGRARQSQRVQTCTVTKGHLTGGVLPDGSAPDSTLHPLPWHLSPPAIMLYS